MRFALELDAWIHGKLASASNERGFITIDEPKMSQLPSDTKQDVSLL